MNKPLILVVNDDGITAPGITALVEVAKKLGEVVVVAPDKPQSAMGHAISLNTALRINHWMKDDINYYACSGTPVDCVKIGVSKLLLRKPDLIISGINHGSNSSINVIYSGTMSAAMEGALEGITSIGFSLCSHAIEADFEAAKIIAEKIIKEILGSDCNGICLNVNIPNVSYDLIKGIKVCKQANGNWIEEYDERVDPHGNSYYWLTGSFVVYDNSDDTDEWALKNNYVSVVPVEHDFTHYSAIGRIKHLEHE